MKTATIVAAFATLAGCASVPMDRAYEVQAVQVRWHQVGWAEVQQKCWPGTPPAGSGAAPMPRACAVPNGGFCDIYAERPVSWTDSVRFQWLGHELTHCFGYVH